MLHLLASVQKYYKKYISESVVLCPSASDWSEQQGCVQKTWFVMEMHSMLQGTQCLVLWRLVWPWPPNTSLSSQYQINV